MSVAFYVSQLQVRCLVELIACIPQIINEERQLPPEIVCALLKQMPTIGAMHCHLEVSASVSWRTCHLVWDS